MHKPLHTPSNALSPLRFALVPTLVVAALLAGCGDKGDKKSASQAAARVNDQEVTVHQINLILERQPGLKPEQMDAGSRQVLEGLIDQELAVQKAEEQKLDRDPKVVQILDAQRRATLARVYLDKASTAGIATPTADDIRKYYDANPGLFSNRRVYVLQEFAIQATPEQAKDLQTRLTATSTPQAFADAIKASGLKFGANQVTQPAESLPIGLVSQLAPLKDGQALFEQVQGGLKAVLIAATRSQPLTYDQAKPLIERFLVESKRGDWLKAHLKDLRSTAKISYIGKFAEKPPAAASGASAAAVPVPAAEPASAASDGGMDAAALNKGLSGLK